MKKSRTLISIMLICLLIAAMSPIFAASGEESGAAADYAAYEYFLNTSDENAYVLFGEKTQQKNCTFLDGISLERTNPLYNELSTEKSLDGRKFYKENYASIRVDKDFYEPGDHEFLVSIVYYDYGPDEGRFHVDYYTEEQTAKRISLVKPGKVQDWFVKTIYIDDADFSGSLDEGGNIRLASNVYNLFKKVEIVNVSKLKREKKAAQISALASTKRDSLINMRIIDGSDGVALDRNLYKPCTLYDAKRLLNRIGAKGERAMTKEDQTVTLTQGELIRLFAKAAGITGEENDACAWADQIGLTSGEDLLLQDSAAASNYNLLSIAYDAFLYESDHQSSLLEDLIGTGFFDAFADTVTNDKFLAKWYRVPKKCPYQIIADNETGQSYYYMNINGNPTWRTYVTAQSWTSDGKSFVCSLADGEMFLYNTETQMLAYIDKASTMVERLHATIGTDDYIYYIKREDGNYSIWKADVKTLKPELVTKGPGMAIYCVQLSNDCNYLSVESDADAMRFARYSVKEDKWDIYSHTFDYSPVLTHAQINPQYPHLMCFSHELLNISWLFLMDRMWVFDCDTGQAKNIFKQGTNEQLGTTLQYVSHELWSNNGEYLYGIAPDARRNMADIGASAPVMVGNTPFAFRVNKDGTHRQYYFDAMNQIYAYNHVYPSGDDQFLVADGDYLVLISTETNEHFPIASHILANKRPHPYQAHPVVARNQYKVSWGGMDQNDMLGVCWFDFTDMAEKKAKGGRYPAGSHVKRVSYAGLDCESTETTQRGKSCYFASSGQSIYLDIDETLVDTDNGQLTLSFDYFDNGTQPIVITYTSGVNTDNDRYRIFDAEKRIKRRNTNTWKRCEIFIDSGNFENIGTYATDLKIKGECANLYLKDISAR